MPQVNLRQTQADSLTIQQADQSLIHLSQLEVISADQQLFTGGDYLSSGNVVLGLPQDGNKFALNIVNGQVTFTGGTLSGQTDATIIGPGRRVFAKIDSDWQQVGSSGGSGSNNFTTLSASALISSANNWVWANSANNPIILSIPVGLPSNTTFFIHRHGSNLVTIDPGGSEGVINPDTGVSDQTGVRINRDGGTIALKKTGSNYEVAVIHNP